MWEIPDVNATPGVQEVAEDSSPQPLHLSAYIMGRFTETVTHWGHRVNLCLEETRALTRSIPDKNWILFP